MAQEEKKDRLVATVEDSEIHESDVVTFVKGMGPELASRFQSEEGVKHVIDELVHQELMYRDAIDRGLDEDEEFLDALAQTKKNLLKSYAFSKIIGNVSVSAEEAKEYYESGQENFSTPETAVASHILVPDEETAKDILKKLEDGEDFRELAKAHSTCPSKDAGGRLGTFTRGQMVDEFDQAVFSMEVGTISEPVKTQFGYHIIRLEEKEEAKEQPFEEVKEHCMREALRLKQQKIYKEKMDELADKYKVTLY